MSTKMNIVSFKFNSYPGAWQQGRFVVASQMCLVRWVLVGVESFYLYPAGLYDKMLSEKGFVLHINNCRHVVDQAHYTMNDVCTGTLVITFFTKYRLTQNDADTFVLHYYYDYLTFDKPWTMPADYEKLYFQDKIVVHKIGKAIIEDHYIDDDYADHASFFQIDEDHANYFSFNVFGHEVVE